MFQRHGSLLYDIPKKLMRQRPLKYLLVERSLECHGFHRSDPYVELTLSIDFFEYYNRL